MGGLRHFTRQRHEHPKTSSQADRPIQINRLAKPDARGGGVCHAKTGHRPAVDHNTRDDSQRQARRWWKRWHE